MPDFADPISRVFTVKEQQCVEISISGYEQKGPQLYDVHYLASRWVPGLTLGYVANPHPGAAGVWIISLVVKAFGDDTLLLNGCRHCIVNGQSYVFRLSQKSPDWRGLDQSTSDTFPGAIKVGHEIEWLESNGLAKGYFVGSSLPEDAHIRPAQERMG
jgi:hypothetical protein